MIKFCVSITSGFSLLVLAVFLSGCSTLGTDSYYASESPERIGDDDQRGALYKTIVEGLGAVDPKEAPIEYKERPALVAPKNKELLSPEKSLDDIIAQTDQWPRDPDVIAAKQAQERAEYERKTGLRDSLGGQERTLLTHEEMKGTGQPFAHKTTKNPDFARDDRSSALLTPEEMKRGHRHLSQKYRQQVDNNGIPKRAHLGEPPEGYRKPTNKKIYDDAIENGVANTEQPRIHDESGAAWDK